MTSFKVAVVFFFFQPSDGNEGTKRLPENWACYLRTQSSRMLAINSLAVLVIYIKQICTGRGVSRPFKLIFL